MDAGADFDAGIDWDAGTNWDAGADAGTPPDAGAADDAGPGTGSTCPSDAGHGLGCFGTLSDGGFDFSPCGPFDGGPYGADVPVEWCRLEVITAACAGGCTADSDCAMVSLPNNCVSFGDACRPTVPDASVAEFSALANAEVQAFCPTFPGQVFLECTYVGLRTTCCCGRCTFLFQNESCP